MCVCARMCTYVHVCARMQDHTPEGVCAHVRVCARICAYVHVCASALPADMSAFKSTGAHACMCARDFNV